MAKPLDGKQKQSPATPHPTNVLDKLHRGKSMVTTPEEERRRSLLKKVKEESAG